MLALFTPGISIPCTVQQIVDEWSSIVDNAEALLKGYMNKVDCSMDASKPDTLILVAKFKTAYDGLMEEEHAKMLSGIINERVRKEVKYELVLDENGTKYSKIPHSKQPNMQIVEEDNFDEGF